MVSAKCDFHLMLELDLMKYDAEKDLRVTKAQANVLIAMEFQMFKQKYSQLQQEFPNLPKARRK